MGNRIIGKGNTSVVYEYGDDRVLKLFYSFIPKKIAIREYENTVIAAKYLNNVAKVYKMIQKEERIGIIYERVEGNDFSSILRSSPSEFSKAITMFTQSHVSIGQVELSSQTDREKMVSVKDYLASQIRKAQLLSKEERSQILDYLSHLPDGNRLCHLDYHPENVVIRDGKMIVLDWMNACAGCREADAARTLVILKYNIASQKPWFTQAIMSLLLRYICKRYIRQYCSLSKCSRKEINQWVLPIAAARLTEGIPQKEKKRLLRVVKNNLGRK